MNRNKYAHNDSPFFENERYGKEIYEMLKIYDERGYKITLDELETYIGAGITALYFILEYLKEKDVKDRAWVAQVWNRLAEAAQLVTDAEKEAKNP